MKKTPCMRRMKLPKCEPATLHILVKLVELLQNCRYLRRAAFMTNIPPQNVPAYAIHLHDDAHRNISCCTFSAI